MISDDSPLGQALNASEHPQAVLTAMRDADDDVADLRIEFLNVGARAIIAPQAPDPTGQPLLSRLPADQGSAILEICAAMLDSGEPFETDVMRVHMNNSTFAQKERLVRMRGSLLGDAALVSWVDVTAELARRQEQRSRETIYELTELRAPVGQALVAQNGTFTHANPAFCRISGHRESELIGKTFQAITHPEDLDVDVAQAAAVANRELDNYEMEKRYMRADGSYVWIKLHVSAVWDGEDFVTFIAQITDIDASKKLQQDLQRRNADLQQFAYVASHDLQAPLRVVSSYTDLLRASLEPGDLNEEQRDYLNEVLAATADMRELIHDLLHYSRATNSSQSRESTSLLQATRAAVADLAANIAQAEAVITVDVDEDLRVNAVPRQLQQVAVNLLSNSLKYRHPQRRCEISVVASREGATTTWVFADNGVGIPAAGADRAFELFQRLQTDGEGTGIGLALVRKLVERSGGQVELESDGSSGTTMVLTFASD